MLSTDRSLLSADSPAALRVRAYAEHFDHIDVIVFSRDGESGVYGNVSVYPTRSWSKFLYGVDAWRIARSLQPFEVVTAQDPFETGLVGSFIARAQHVPLHIQVHTDFLAPQFVRHSLYNRPRLLLVRYVLARAACVRVVSERIKEKIEKHYYRHPPIMVLPIFVDTEKYAHLPRLKHPRFKISLLMIGRIEREKNIPRALDALLAARKEGHDAGLTIVGAGSGEYAVKAYARKLGLERFVECTGWQSDITRYLSMADLVLVSSEYEGYGMVILEALAAGVPVLATDVGIAREAGAIVVRREEFAQALIRWISSGPRSATLLSYPYPDFESYVRAWCRDVKSAVLSGSRAG